MTTPIEQAVPETAEQSELEQKATALVIQVDSFVIVTNDDRTLAENVLQDIKDVRDKRFTYLDPPRKMSYERWQYDKRRLDEAIDPLDKAQKAVKQKCIQYDNDQENIRRVAQAKAEAEARARAEQEALEAAVAAEQSGDKELAEEILQEPIQVAPVVVPRTAPAASRLSAGRSVWSAEGISLAETVKAIMEGRAPLQAVCFDTVFLNQQARAFKSALKIPGVRAVERKA